MRSDRRWIEYPLKTHSPRASRTNRMGCSSIPAKSANSNILWFQAAISLDVGSQQARLGETPREQKNSHILKSKGRTILQLGARLRSAKWMRKRSRSHKPPTPA